MLPVLPALLGATVLGALGLTIARDAWSVLAWLALAAPAAGHVVTSARVPLRDASRPHDRRHPAATLATRCAALLAPPLVWAAIVAWLARGSAAPPEPLGALAILGLYALGLATGRAGAAHDRASSGLAGAGVWLALLALLAGAPMGWGVVSQPWPPDVAARLLDLSPLSVVLESAGADWMRHPAVYDPAGTLDIGPQMRVAWRGTLAGPGLLVVGCAALGAAVVLRPRVPASTRKDS